jgi:hypothetical protein
VNNAGANAIQSGNEFRCNNQRAQFVSCFSTNVTIIISCSSHIFLTVMPTLKRLLTLFVVALSIQASAFAQDDKLKDFTFDEVPTMPMFQDFTKLNETVGAITGGTLNGPMWLLGGQGFVAIGIIPNVRVGVFSVAGSSSSERESGGVTRRAEYNMSMTGMNIDYAFMPFKGFAVLPGVNLGAGTVSFEASQSSGSRTFPQTFPPSGLPPTATSYMSFIRANHFFVQPNVNLEYAFSLLTMIRLNVGYSFSFMGDWRADKVAAIANVPSSYNASGVTAQIGLFVGLFNN